MRKLFTLISVFLSASMAYAQGGIPLLDKAAGERVSFHYTYSLSQKGADFFSVTDGDVVVEGNCYILEGLGLEVRSDGETRWTTDRDAKELLIENVEGEDLFTNPALFLSSYKNYMDKIVVNSEGENSLDVTLILDDETKARFVLSNVDFEDAMQGKSGFTMDVKSLPQDFVITDLR